MLTSFEDKMKSEYYRGNISVSIKSIVLEQYKQVQYTKTGREAGNPSRHAVFYSFLSNDIKQDAATTASHSKHPTKLNIYMFADISKIWENTGGCAEQYICVTGLYLLTTLDHDYDIIIDRSVGSPGNGQYIVDVLNTIKKRFYTC